MGDKAMIKDPKRFADEWIESWNSHDLKRILAHYSDDFEITTPMIRKLLGDDTGTLHGKGAIKQYWESALAKVPDLHFELIDIAVGIDSIVVYYKSILATRAMEVMYFNHEEKVHKIVAHYSL